MKLYLTAAGVYAGTQIEAKRDGKGWTPEEVPTDKQGLIDYLNALKHSEPTVTALADGARETQDEVDQRTLPPAPSYAHQSVAFDDEFDAMGLRRQLGYAARAMNNAIDKL